VPRHANPQKQTAGHLSRWTDLARGVCDSFQINAKWSAFVAANPAASWQIASTEQDLQQRETRQALI
jgi:hypothetical protein